jgi:hypothetical protein
MTPGQDARRFSRRTKTLEVTVLGEGRYEFEAILLDESRGGRYEEHARDHMTIHHFVITGVAAGPELRLESLQVRAEEHPFPQCPFVIPAAERLIGSSLLSGWRKTVLGRLGGSAGCTHVTTLLLGLAEMTTLVYFQQINELVDYGPAVRARGEWIAASLSSGQNLVRACHVLESDGPVIGTAERYLQRRGDTAP